MRYKDTGTNTETDDIFKRLCENFDKAKIKKWQKQWKNRDGWGSYNQDTMKTLPTNIVLPYLQEKAQSEELNIAMWNILYKFSLWWNFK